MAHWPIPHTHHRAPETLGLEHLMEHVEHGHGVCPTDLQTVHGLIWLHESMHDGQVVTPVERLVEVGTRQEGGLNR